MGRPAIPGHGNSFLTGSRQVYPRGCCLQSLSSLWRMAAYTVFRGITQDGRPLSFFVQDAEVGERTLVLQKVFNRYTAGKLIVTDTQPDVSGSASFSMLVRSLISPISSNRAVFEHIVSFLTACAYPCFCIRIERLSYRSSIITPFCQVKEKVLGLFTSPAGDPRFTESFDPDTPLVGFLHFVGMSR